MSSMTKTAALVAVWAALPLSLTAQQPAVPIVAMVDIPANSSWTMEVSQDQAPEAERENAPGRTTRVEIVQFSGLRHGIEHHTDGSKWEWWARNDHVIRPAENGGFYMEAVEAPPPDSTDIVFPAAGFPGLHWLAHAHNRSSVVLGGKRCQYFAADLVDGRAEAWIEIDTQRPVRIRLGGTTYNITFSPAPASAPEIPGRALADIEAVEAIRHRAAWVEKRGRR